MENNNIVPQNGGNKIIVYDLEGNVIYKYILDRYIYGFWIDEENKKDILC